MLQLRVNQKNVATLIDGKAIAGKIETEVAARVAALKETGAVPKLAVVLVGDDEASGVYVRRKGEAARRVGIDFNLHEFPSDIGKDEFIAKLREIQNDPALAGLIIQIPVPEILYNSEVLNTIRRDIDVDCLTEENLGKLVMQSNFIVPPTPGAAVTILEELNTDLTGKDVIVVGAGALVGKPLAIMLLNKKCTVTVCNSSTRDLKSKCLGADIIISGVGKKGLIRGDMVKDGAVIIDAGIFMENGKTCGDVNMEDMKDKSVTVTPTPGGVGPVTVARLLLNTVICAERLNAK